mmetsp:Transcript_26076/g.32576  ORF Transcript_26076/g.32576 Transcript_26076/m.32576 type:complete len:97 (+) Transcript_26076:37-327(+)
MVTLDGASLLAVSTIDWTAAKNPADRALADLAREISSDNSNPFVETIAHSADETTSKCFIADFERSDSTKEPLAQGVEIAVAFEAAVLPTGQEALW